MLNTPSNPRETPPAVSPGTVLMRCCARVGRFSSRVHRDEQGTISIISVIALMLFTILLGMVINVGRHVDDKVKQQNAVDSASVSGGLALARGMNSLAFSNHLLCDVFALTAFMREARDRNAEALTPEILQAWSTIAPIFQRSQFPKFKGLGAGIPEKVEAERRMIQTYSEFAAAVSEAMLPALEQILREESIPQFQRSVVQIIPLVSQQITGEVARRHGLKPDQELAVRGQTYGALWRLNRQALEPVGQSGESDPMLRSLPVVDPSPTGADFNSLQNANSYKTSATIERQRLSTDYLSKWNQSVRHTTWNVDWLGTFNLYAEMSQFYGLWEIFTKGQLCKLLNEEYPESNLLFQIRRMPPQTGSYEGLTPDEFRTQIRPDWRPAQGYLEDNFRFGAVTYRKPLREMFGKLFVNQQTSDAMTFAEVALFIPQPRWHFGVPASCGPDWGRESWPTGWSLLSQNWTVQLVPATADGFVEVLQSSPGQFAPNASLPNLAGAGSPQSLRQINTH